MRHLFILCIIIFLAVSGNGQCPTYIELKSQGAIDSFKLHFPSCSILDTLVVDGKEAPIYNLHGLLGIKYVKELNLFVLNNVEILSGLDSLAEVSHFSFSGNPKIKSNIGIENLHKINKISHSFAGVNANLNLYKNVKYINSLSTLYDGYIAGLDSFERQDSFTLSVRENHLSNDFVDFQEQSDLLILHLYLYDCSNIDISQLGCDIDRLTMSLCADVKLGDQFDKNVKHLVLEKSTFQSSPSFKSIDTANVISIIDIDQFYSLAELIPNLNAINSYIGIVGNENLENITSLNKVTIPTVNINFPYRVNIVDNSKLDSCANLFICKALTTYPDSVQILNNSSIHCSKEEVIAQCINSGADINANSYDKVYPNPCSDFVKFEEICDNYSLYNLQGQKIWSGHNESAINTTSLQSGIYLLSYSIKNKFYVQKLVKI